MSRKERRALAHANSKNTTPPSVTVNITQEPVTAPVKPEISEAQLAANRANAQLSTGPSAASLKKTSLNALKTGLTGRQVLLPADDGALYEAMVRDYQNHFSPVGPEEIAKQCCKSNQSSPVTPVRLSKCKSALTSKKSSATWNCKRTVSSAVANGKRRNSANSKPLGRRQAKKLRRNRRKPLNPMLSALLHQMGSFFQVPKSLVI
jgi:hypothetical protein